MHVLSVQVDLGVSLLHFAPLTNAMVISRYTPDRTPIAAACT